MKIKTMSKIQILKTPTDTFLLDLSESTDQIWSDSWIHTSCLLQKLNKPYCNTLQSNYVLVWFTVVLFIPHFNHDLQAGTDNANVNICSRILCYAIRSNFDVNIELLHVENQFRFFKFSIWVERVLFESIFSLHWNEVRSHHFIRHQKQLDYLQSKLTVSNLGK